MARSKKEVIEETTVEVEVSEEQTLKDKLEQSEKEKNEMFAMMQEMRKQIEELKNANSSQPQITFTQNQDLTRTVKVISMINNVYNLSTKPLGGGKLYTFRKYGDFKNIKFTDMQEILEIYRKDFEIGRAILGSKKDYEDLNIGYAYDEVLNKEQMDKLISLKEKDSIDVILGLDEDMQEKVAFLIADRMSKGQSYDFNKIKNLEDNGIYVQEKARQLEENKE